MNVRTALTGTFSVMGLIAISGAFCAGAVIAKDYNVEVAIRVNSQGLDLRQPAGAHEFLARVQHAADVACTHGNRVDLKPLDDVKSCRESAIGDAVRSANAPLVTQAYLETHTLQQAAAYRIKLPQRVAAN